MAENKKIKIRNIDLKKISDMEYMKTFFKTEEELEAWGKKFNDISSSSLKGII